MKQKLKREIDKSTIIFRNFSTLVWEGDGTPLQYSCLENPVDGGAWWAAVHEVAKSWTRLSNFTFTFHFHALEKEMATLSSVLAWRIPGTGEPGGLPSLGSHRVGHDWSDLAAADDRTRMNVITQRLIVYNTWIILALLKNKMQIWRKREYVNENIDLKIMVYNTWIFLALLKTKMEICRGKEYMNENTDLKLTHSALNTYTF